MQATHRVSHAIAFCLGATLLSSSIPGFAKSAPSKKVVAHFIVVSMSLRNKCARSYDIYLIGLRLSRTSEPFLAKLVDEYPPTPQPLARFSLINMSLTTLRIIREPEYEVAFFDLQLRGCPGDITSILPKPMQFRPVLNLPTNAVVKLPCYELSRK